MIKPIRPIQRPQNPVHDVRNVGKLSDAAAVSVPINRHFLVNFLNKLQTGHVWSSSRPINREKAQHGGGDLVQMPERGRPQLVATFGAGVSWIFFFFLDAHNTQKKKN